MDASAGFDVLLKASYHIWQSDAANDGDRDFENGVREIRKPWRGRLGSRFDLKAQ